MGLYGHKIVWIFPGWYGTHWWQTENQDGCSRKQMDRAAEGHLVFGHFYLNPKQKRGIAGLTPEEFVQAFQKRQHWTSYTHYDFVAGPCYDVIWTLALALNNTVTVMHREGRVILNHNISCPCNCCNFSRSNHTNVTYRSEKPYDRSNQYYI